MEPAIILLVVFLIGIAFAWFGSYVADQKGRAPGEGALLGALFGPLGVLVEALLPTLERGGEGASRASRIGSTYHRKVWTPEYRDDWEPEPEPSPGDPDEDAAYQYLTGVSPPERRSEGRAR